MIIHMVEDDECSREQMLEECEKLGIELYLYDTVMEASKARADVYLIDTCKLSWFQPLRFEMQLDCLCAKHPDSRVLVYSAMGAKYLKDLFDNLPENAEIVEYDKIDLRALKKVVDNQ